MAITTRHPRRRTAFLTALAVTGASLLGGAFAPAASAAPAFAVDTVDYFDDAYPGLGPDSVFETVTFERFEYLLNSDGRFAFLIGGPDSENTNAVISHINDVAVASGIDTVYNFNPKLDGETLDVRTSTNEAVAALYDRILSEYLNKDTQTAFDGGSDDPYLFVYDKNHTADGAEDRIVAALDDTKTAAELASPGAVTAYKTQVAAVLGPADELDTLGQFDFYSSEVNRKHHAQFPADPGLVGGDILTQEDADFRLQGITYPELVNVLQSDGDYVIFFGGTWCHNTRAVVKEVNRQAVANGVEKVYFFDLRLDGNSGNDLHIRDTGSEFAHLYGELVDSYLPNLVTQYDVNSQSASQKVTYFPGGDTTATAKNAKKLQVPYVFEYNKDRSVGEQPAPVAQQWIHDNGDGTYREYMTEWWYVLGLDGFETRPDRLATQHAFASEAITALGTFFGALPGEGEQPAVPVAPTAPVAPTVTASGSSVTVTWPAPANGGSPITGYAISLNGGAPVAVAADRTSYTFEGLAAGTYTATVAAINAVGSSPASQPSASVVIPASVEPSTVKGQLAVSGALRPGGVVTITGTGFAPDTEGFSVELQSTPQLLGTVTTLANGSFRLVTTIPASVNAGNHSVVVSIDGVEVARAAVAISADSAADAGSLADTGTAEAQLLAWLGLGLIGAGVGVVWLLRSRRRQTS